MTIRRDAPRPLYLWRGRPLMMTQVETWNGTTKAGLWREINRRLYTRGKDRLLDRHEKGTITVLIAPRAYGLFSYCYLPSLRYDTVPRRSGYTGMPNEAEFRERLVVGFTLRHNAFSFATREAEARLNPAPDAPILTWIVRRG